MYVALYVAVHVGEGGGDTKILPPPPLWLNYTDWLGGSGIRIAEV